MIGEGRNRVDGPLKVTGGARYSAERLEARAPLHGVIVAAGIAKGRIVAIDTAAADAMPGVRLVWTYRNAPRQAAAVPKGDLHDPCPQLQDDVVAHAGTSVAFVVAETLEAARAAAQVIEVTYEREDGSFVLPTDLAPPKWNNESRIGNFESALADAPVSIDVRYSTPYHFSQPMELNACVADWQDGRLTLYLTSQMVAQVADAVAETLMIDRDLVTVDSAYVGGGFGSKIAIHAEAVLSSLAARKLGRPVKVMMSRRQIFSLVGHRPATVSRIRLGADRDGRLVALGHDTVYQTSPAGNWKEGVANVARPLYAAPHRLTRHGGAELDTGIAEPVRGPGEVPGLITFESAMDELAEALGMDPVELRLRNDTDIDPEKNVPLTGRRLAECLRLGAQRFGWSERPKSPRSRREGNWLIGYGVASSIRGHFQNDAKVTVRLEPEGRVVVLTDMTDIGTGTYTVTAQQAAESLGVPFETIEVRLARSDLPRTWGAGGSWGSGNISVATDRACQMLREQVAAVAPGYNDLFAEVRRHFPDGVEATGETISMDDIPDFDKHSRFTYGATYCEVGVDADTAEVRVRRLTGVFAAGRILNEKTARSQMIGGMIWGVGAALHEGAYPDPHHGLWVNADLAEYLIPVHADIPDIDVVMLDDFDEHANHLGIKGIGELGSGGTGAAVANAVYNATGVRVRDFPIGIAKVLEGMA